MTQSSTNNITTDTGDGKYKDIRSNSLGTFTSLTEIVGPEAMSTPNSSIVLSTVPVLVFNPEAGVEHKLST